MPKQVKASGLAAKLGDAGRKAFDEHKADEPVFGGGADLPAGIEGGVAKLVQCKFDKHKEGDNKGQYYFMAAGIVQSPKEHGGIPIQGLRTQIGPEPLYDTPSRSRKTVADHVQWVLNEFHKLGVDTSSMTINDFEATATVLEEEQPTFRFRTWKGSKATSGIYKDREPRVQHDWRGICEVDAEQEDEPVEDATDEDDETAEAEEEDEAGAAEETEAEATEEDESSGEEAGDEPDLDALAEAADTDDKEAGEQLTALAVEAGIASKAVAKAKSWAAVVGMIRKASPAEEEEEAAEEEETAEEEEAAEEEEEEKIPEKAELYNYRPTVMDTKTKKRVKAKKPVECEVIAVNAKKQTVDLKNLDTSKVYKGVSWDDIKE
jgi:hypothetical protein